MKTTSLLAAGLLLLLAPAAARAAKVTSDLTPPVKRQAVVDTADRLAQHKAPAAVPTDMPSPFAPADFDRVEPKTPGGPGAGGGPGGAGGAGPGGGGRGPGGGAGGAVTAGPVVVTPPTGPAADRETLETLANQIQPTGVLQFGNEPQLIIKSTRFKIGTRFTATYNGQDYELELVAIDRTTFTLRYRGEEITRPIRPTR